MLNRIQRIIAVYLAVVGGVFFLILLGVVCVNVTTRSFDMPIRGAVESSGLFSGLTAALAIGYAQICHNHITGGVAIQTLPRFLRRILDALAAIIGIVFYCAATWEMLDLGLFTLETGETIDGVGALYPWLILMTAPGFAGQAVIMFLILCGIVFKGDETCLS